MSEVFVTLLYDQLASSSLHKLQAVFDDYNKLRVGDYDPIKLHIHQKLSIGNNKYKSDNIINNNNKFVTVKSMEIVRIQF